MKKIIPLIALAALCLGFTFGHAFRWSFKKGADEQSVFRLKTIEGTTLEFGLRSDGVVVWREFLSTTNSPAEDANNPNTWNYKAWTTNYIMINGGITNGTINYDSLINR